MIYLGIEASKKGGICAIDDEQNVLFKCPMPLIQQGRVDGADYDLNAIIKVFRLILFNCPANQIRCVIEKPTPNRLMGFNTTYLIGFGSGLIQGALATLGVSFEVISAPVWQTAMFPGQKKMVNAAVDMCQRKYPAFFDNVKHGDYSGIANSTCIALFCWQKYKGEAIKYG
jgi:hypothetical protein